MSSSTRFFACFLSFSLFVFGASADDSDIKTKDPKLLQKIAKETGFPPGVFPHGATEAQKEYVRNRRKHRNRASQNKERSFPPPAQGYRAPGEFEPATFRMIVCDSPVQYQWYFNDHPISGATNWLLHLATAHSTDPGNYHATAFHAGAWTTTQRRRWTWPRS